MLINHFASLAHVSFKENFPYLRLKCCHNEICLYNPRDRTRRSPNEAERWAPMLWMRCEELSRMNNGAEWDRSEHWSKAARFSSMCWKCHLTETVLKEDSRGGLLWMQWEEVDQFGLVRTMHMSLKSNRVPVIKARCFSKSSVLKPFSGVDLLLLYLYNYSTMSSPWRHCVRYLISSTA